MKKKIFFSIIFFAAVIAISLIAKSQSVGSLDTISLGDFDMSPIGIGNLSYNTALQSEADFQSRFGVPGISSVDYSELEENNMNHYIYSGAEAWYMNDGLQALVFTSPNYQFTMTNGNIVKVGDNISAIANMFPSSWAGRTTINRLFVGLKNSNGPVDMTILFEFDLKTNLITLISIQQ